MSRQRRTDRREYAGTEAIGEGQPCRRDVIDVDAAELLLAELDVVHHPDAPSAVGQQRLRRQRQRLVAGDHHTPDARLPQRLGRRQVARGRAAAARRVDRGSVRRADHGAGGGRQRGQFEEPGLLAADRGRYAGGATVVAEHQHPAREQLHPHRRAEPPAGDEQADRPGEQDLQQPQQVVRQCPRQRARQAAAERRVGHQHRRQRDHHHDRRIEQQPTAFEAHFRAVEADRERGGADRADQPRGEQRARRMQRQRGRRRLGPGDQHRVDKDEREPQLGRAEREHLQRDVVAQDPGHRQSSVHRPIIAVPHPSPREARPRTKRPRSRELHDFWSRSGSCRHGRRGHGTFRHSMKPHAHSAKRRSGPAAAHARMPALSEHYTAAAGGQAVNAMAR